MQKVTPSQDIEDSSLESFLGYHLRRASVLVMGSLSESLAELALTPADASVLLVIGSAPGVTQSELGRTLGILRANMTPLIGNLIRQGFIEREAVDGRSQALYLSAAGQRLGTKARLAMRQHEDRLFGALSEAARLRLIGQLKALWKK